MPQTLLALAAILCFTYLALGRQTSDREAEMQSIRMELELAATDVAQALMTRVERNAFDEDDTGRTGVRTQPSTYALGPDPGEDAPVDFDDVDDWTGYQGTEAPRVGAGVIPFRTFVHVRYVEDADPSRAASSATLTKEITVVALEVQPAGTERHAARAMLRRVVTPAGISSATPVIE